MADETIPFRSSENNYLLLDQACMLLRAAEDIIVNENADLFHLVYSCPEEKLRKKTLNQLDLLYSGITGAAKILQSLSSADRDSWTT